ncbi:hypothetical protein KQX54_003386 [Cotesia glomerata]|uniref:Ionotropic receptor n=1 Tax=Cotesia glomerata TaxID=32391 RepID=A0AAV7IJ13_COTGL|nr:hypothetical protein KQX54_003386 [Cotesia glomerata]
MKQGIIFFCLVIARVNGNKMIINDRQQENSLGRLKRNARELVEMCFTNNSNPVMISEDLLDNNWNPGENSLIVIDRKFNKKITGFLPAYPTYVLPFKSIDNLKPAVDNLQRSKFWNIGSPFLMVGTGSRCSSTKKLLEFMWNRDLLFVYYLCENKNSSVIYTLNPYASYAPAPWKLIEKFGDSDKKLTLFRLEYIKDPQICKSITFDKTDHLENAEIKFVRFYNNTCSKEENKKIAERLVEDLLKTDYINIYKISALINATPMLEIIPTSLLQRSEIQEFADSRYDIYGSMRFIDATDYEYVDVIAEYSYDSTFSIVTKKTDSLTGISEITNNVQFIVATSLLLILFTIVMVIIKRNDVGLAVMEMVRLVTGRALETPLNRLAITLIFFFGFLFAFLIVPDCLGNTIAMLMRPPKRNVDTLRDLYENKFHVYYLDILETDIMNEQLWVTGEDKKYLHPFSLHDNVDYIRNLAKNSTIAYILFTEDTQFMEKSTDWMYSSTDAVFEKQFIFWARKNWPLMSKFNKMALKASDRGSGFKIYLKYRYLDNVMKKSVKKARIKERENYKYFDYDDLIFNYYSFGFLIALGILIFGIEIILSRYLRIYRQFQIRARH